MKFVMAGATLSALVGVLLLASVAMPVHAVVDVVGLTASSQDESPGKASKQDGVEARRPRYERVEPSGIETLWQRPHAGKKISGVLFVAHGCMHQGTDIFTPRRGNDTWEFEACRSSNYGGCLGLPEELRLREVARDRGLLVMAASGGDGKMSCWYPGDEPFVASAISHVYAKEGLDKSVPLYALGASSGGSFVGQLANFVADWTSKPQNFPELKCIIPQIMEIPRQIRPVPTLFVHMPKDRRTASGVKLALQDLKKRGTAAAEIQVKESKVTSSFFADHRGVEGKISKDAANDIVDALKKGNFVSEEGLLQEDPRQSDWRDVVRPVVVKHNVGDDLQPDESVLAELMNVLWAQHEFSSADAASMLDFCEDPKSWTPPATGTFP